MEDYVWIFILGAFWLFEIASKAIKGKGKTEDGDLDASRPDPRRSSRDLSREIDASARHAEDALQRWEAKQREVVPVPSRPAEQRRASKTQRRREAFEAIASMLAAPRQEQKAVPVQEQEERVVTVAPPRRARRPVPEPEVSSGVRRAARSGIGRLSGLGEIQRAIVLSEILGPPVSLARKSAFHQDPD